MDIAHDVTVPLSSLDTQTTQALADQMLHLLFDRHSRSSVHTYATFSARNIGITIFSLASVLSLHALCIIATLPTPPNPAYEGFGHIFSVAVASARERPVLSSELSTRTFNETAFIETLPLTEEELRRMTREKRKMHSMILENNEKLQHIGGNATHPFVLERYTLHFGSMIRNWCNMTAPNGTFSLNPTTGLPSILRGMEISMPVQISFRLTVMLAMSIRWVATMVGDYRVAMEKGCPAFIKWTAALHTPTVMVQMVSISLLSTVHSDIDVSIRDAIPISLVAFCITSIVDMSMLIALDRTKESSSLRRSLREVFFLVSFISFPVIYTAHMEFFHFKVCSIQVPWWVGLAEYSFALTVVGTCLLQLLEFANLELAVQLCEEDVELRVHHSFIGRYEPNDRVLMPSLEVTSRSPFLIGNPRLYDDVPCKFEHFDVVKGVNVHHTENTNITSTIDAVLVASGLVINHTNDKLHR